MGFSLATLFVDIKARDDEMQRQINGVRSQLGAVGVAIGTAAGNLLSSVLSRSTAALSGFVSSGIRGAMELQDTMGAVQATMGAAAPKIFGFVDDMANKYGVIKTESMKASLSFAQMFKQAGQSSDKAADTGTGLVKLGMDLTRYFGGSYKQAFEAIQGSLQGNFQGNLDRYNIFLTMAEVNQQAVNMGLARNVREVDEAAKKQAILNLIMQKSVDMQGQMEREANQAGAQWAKATGGYENAATALATSLMPAITAVTQGLADMVSGVAAGFAANREAVASWGESIGATIRAIPQYWDEFQAGVGIASLRVEAFGTNTLAWIGVLPENFARFGKWFSNNWVGLIRDGANAALSIFRNLGTNLMDLWTAVKDYFKTGRFEFNPTDLLEGFKATVGELPEIARPALASMDDAIAAVGEDLARKTAARQQAATAAAGAAPAQRAAEQVSRQAAARQKEFQSETFDSADFYERLRSAGLSGKEDTAKKQLDLQAKQLAATERTNELLARGTVARFA